MNKVNYNDPNLFKKIGKSTDLNGEDIQAAFEAALCEIVGQKNWKNLLAYCEVKGWTINEALQSALTNVLIGYVQPDGYIHVEKCKEAK